MTEGEAELEVVRANVLLERVLVGWGRGLAALARGDFGGDNPLDTELVDRTDELEDAKDELSLALHAWLVALRTERDAWDDRVALARAWQEERIVPGLDAPVSLRALRRELLREPVRGLRETRARAFSEMAGPVSDLAVAQLVRRLDRERAAFIMADTSAELAPLVAARLLARTEDVAGEMLGEGFGDGLHAAIGSGATEGWPAKLTSRWLGSVVAPILLEGLRVEMPALPRPWGAASFARALGSLGVAILEAGRPKTVPRSLHQRPRGTRRYQRFALFASIVGEESFAQRALGLGRDRALVHRRAVARAFCASLRIAALRVELESALLDGESSARDRHAELSQRLFGESAPASLVGVLPQLRPTDGAALVGTILAAPARDALVHAHDEDWYKNPRAAERIRADDQRPAAEAPSPGDVMAAVDRLGDHLEAAIG